MAQEQDQFGDGVGASKVLEVVAGLAVHHPHRHRLTTLGGWSCGRPKAVRPELRGRAAPRL